MNKYQEALDRIAFNYGLSELDSETNQIMDELFGKDVRSLQELINKKMPISQLDILKKWLEVKQIPFVTVDDEVIKRVHLYKDDFRYLSVIQGLGTYGSNWGLLEIQGLLTDEEEEFDSVVGWLTSLDVSNRIEKYWSDEE